MTRSRIRAARLPGVLLLGLGLMSFTASAQDKEFAFDAGAFTPKPLSLNGYLELRPSLFRLNADSPFFKMKFYDREPRKWLEEGYFALLAGLSYKKGIFEAYLEPYLDVTVSPIESLANGRLFQGYLSLKPSPALTIHAGKRTLRWGKGYAWSPTAFVEREKNPNEPDLAREGYWMITADFTKSFGGALQTLSITPVLIPVSRSVNKTFSPTDGLNFSGKVYLLFLDTDIDLIVSAGKSRGPRFGLDFSRNLRSNWEVHGEIAVLRDVERRLVGDDGEIREDTLSATSWLVGLRYLSAAETTTILEYHHDGSGLRPAEMEAFYAFVDGAYEDYLATGDDAGLIEASDLSSYAGFTPMTDYLFCRVMQKDPFGILYLNPAATAIVNLSDGSASWSPELTYKGITNLELRIKAALLTGKNSDEFREKRNRFRLEFRARYYF